MSKAEYKVILWMLFIFILATAVLLFNNIKEIFWLRQVNKHGQLINADIINVEMARYITISYQHKDQVYRKRLSLSDAVFNYYKEAQIFPIEISPGHPEFFTWDDDRRLYSDIFSIALLIIVLVIMVYALVEGVAWLKRSQ